MPSDYISEALRILTYCGLLYQSLLQHKLIPRKEPLPRILPVVALPAAESLLEIKTMLTDQTRNWTHQWKMEGLQEGRREGRQEGEASLLQRLLTRKFGVLPAALQQRIQTTTPMQLETWSLNILDAATLDDVFTE